MDETAFTKVIETLGIRIRTLESVCESYKSDIRAFESLCESYKSDIDQMQTREIENTQRISVLNAQIEAIGGTNRENERNKAIVAEQSRKLADFESVVCTLQDELDEQKDNVQQLVGYAEHIEQRLEKIAKLSAKAQRAKYGRDITLIMEDLGHGK